MRGRVAGSLVWAGLLAATVARGAPADSTAASAGSLRLDVLEAQALRADPRVRQIELERARSRLRLRSLGAELLPSLTGEAQGQYQSDVTKIPLNAPGLPSPAHDTYDAHVALSQRLFDPAIGPRRTAERAQLAESEARIGTTLFGLRQEVQTAFFGAALLQERAAEIGATIADLEARLHEVEPRVKEGTALRSEAAVVEATLIERRQDQSTLEADRRAQIEVLEALTGTAIDRGEAIALPDLDAEVGKARGALAGVRARPEYQQYARTRLRLSAEQRVASAKAWPRLSSFARLGYGRPGLNPLSDTFDSYWLAGVQLQWTPWTWGTTARDGQALALQREIVSADEAAFTAALQRGVRRDLAALDRLDSTLVLDERVIALREGVERETRLRFQEGVVTAADYLDHRNDLLAARLARAAHRVERAQTGARFLTTLGLEVRR